MKRTAKKSRTNFTYSQTLANIARRRKRIIQAAREEIKEIESNPEETAVDLTDPAMRAAYEVGMKRGRYEAKALPSEHLVELIEFLREMHDHRKIDSISSAGICIFIDKEGEPVDEAAAIAAVMPIAKSVMERRNS